MKARRAIAYICAASRNELLVGSAATLFLKLLGMALSLAVLTVLARILGPHGYGIYAYATALVSVLVIPAEAGLGQLVVRETSSARAHNDWARMRGAWVWAGTTALGSSLAIVAIGAIVLSCLGAVIPAEERVTIQWSLLLIPLVALGNLRGAALRGLDHVVLGQLPEMILRPAVLLAVLLIALVSGGSLAPYSAMAFQVSAAAIAFLAGALLLRWQRPLPLRTKPVPQYHTGRWLRATLPLVCLGGLHLANTHADILMLGVFRSPDQVGVYRVVATVSSLVAFGLQAVNMAIAPRFSMLYARGQREELEAIAVTGARAATLIAAPAFLIIAILGEELLTAAFGPAYGAGHLPLFILATGQLINALMGSVANLLTMTGHERNAMRGAAASAALNICMNFILIPPMGVTGAAIATAVSLMLWNVLMWLQVRSRLRIACSALGI